MLIGQTLALQFELRFASTNGFFKVDGTGTLRYTEKIGVHSGVHMKHSETPVVCLSAEAVALLQR